MGTEQFFRNQVEKYQSQTQFYKRRSTLFSYARFLIFTSSVIALYNAYSSPLFIPLLIVALFLFSLVVVLHYPINQKKVLCENITAVNLDELKRLHGNLDEVETGIDYLNSDHPYGNDLDIFGIGSLFQHITRCILKPSKLTLSHYLTGLQDQETVIKRQNAIQELAKNIEWIQTLQGLLKTEKELDAMKLEHFKGQISWFHLVAAFVFPAISISVFISWMVDLVPFSLWIITLIVNGIIVGTFKKQMEKLDISFTEINKSVQVYNNAFQHIASHKFDSTLLVEYWELISNSTLHEMKRLKYLVYFMDSRSNQFYQFFNVFVMLDFHLFGRFDNWLQRNQEQYETWIDTVHHFEALNSMALYHFTHPNFTFPDFSDKNESTLKGIGIGHPLIPGKEMVSNDFDADNKSIFLITGSNMSGKSTFLRTIGINVIMAWIGLPVCAERLSLSRFLVFTSMRTQDELVENTSSFYAELKRLKKMLEYIKHNDVPILFFVDEILKGTNSKDRHDGAVGLIEYLSQTSANGFVSTHDLGLSEYFKTNTKVINLSFNSTLEKGKLKFDYKLNPGVCQSTNATQLMSLMGLPTHHEE